MMKIFGGLEMSKFQETKTYQNLINAYAGESQARNRYTFFASVAKKAGYEQIAAIFEETAYNEKEHAKLYYKHIQDNLDEVPNMITVTGTYPIELSDTAANLLSAAQGEEDEVVDYTEWSKVAKEEGYDDVARTFRNIASVEEHHGKRYRALRDNVLNDKVFEKEESTEWICRVCGYIHTGVKAPEMCPTCKHPKAYFEVFCANY